MATPEEAVAELRYAVTELGFKSVVIAGPCDPQAHGRPADRRTGSTRSASTAPTTTTRFWAECVELGVTPVFHSACRRTASPARSRNYVYNHIGGLAAQPRVAVQVACSCRGCLTRFPDVALRLPRGRRRLGVQPARGLVGHWEKRHARTRSSSSIPTDPRCRRADEDSSREYGDARCCPVSTSIRDDFAAPRAGRSNSTSSRPAHQSADDIIDRLRAALSTSAARPTTRSVGWATERRSTPAASRSGRSSAPTSRTGTRPVMNEVIVEAFELLEDKVLDESDFRAFTFENPVALHKAGERGLLPRHRLRKGSGRGLAQLSSPLRRMKPLDAQTVARYTQAGWWGTATLGERSSALRPHRSVVEFPRTGRRLRLRAGGGAVGSGAE